VGRGEWAAGGGCLGGKGVGKSKWRLGARGDQKNCGYPIELAGAGEGSRQHYSTRPLGTRGLSGKRKISGGGESRRKTARENLPHQKTREEEKIKDVEGRINPGGERFVAEQGAHKIAHEATGASKNHLARGLKNRGARGRGTE